MRGKEILRIDYTFVLLIGKWRGNLVIYNGIHPIG